ncbi:hypothetical protein ACFX1T_043391 [Malus domestica]
MDVRLEEAVDALVLQEAAAKVARQKARSNQVAGDAGDISELFSDSEVKAKPKVETGAPRQARATMVETSESMPEERPQPRLDLTSPRATLIKKMTRSHIS